MHEIRPVPAIAGDDVCAETVACLLALGQGLPASRGLGVGGSGEADAGE